GRLSDVAGGAVVLALTATRRARWGRPRFGAPRRSARIDRRSGGPRREPALGAAFLQHLGGGRGLEPQDRTVGSCLLHSQGRARLPSVCDVALGGRAAPLRPR